MAPATGKYPRNSPLTPTQIMLCIASLYYERKGTRGVTTVGFADDPDFLALGKLHMASVLQWTARVSLYCHLHTMGGDVDVAFFCGGKAVCIDSHDAKQDKRRRLRLVAPKCGRHCICGLSGRPGRPRARLMSAFIKI